MSFWDKVVEFLNELFKPAPQPAPIKKSEEPAAVATAPVVKIVTGQKGKVIPFAKKSKYAMPTKGTYAKGYPQGLIVHFSAGQDGAENILSWGKGQGYCFLAIQRDGQLFQGHDVDRWGYHAGESNWPGLGASVSDKLIGVELNAAGQVTKLQDGTFKTWWNGAGSVLQSSDVRFTEGEDNQQKGYYHRYTEAQEKQLVELIMWLKAQAPDIFNLDYVLGHDEVAGPKGIGRWRKNDPGAALSMTMSEFRTMLKAEWAKRSGGVVPIEPAKPVEQTSRNQVFLAKAKGIGYEKQAQHVLDVWQSRYPGKNPRYRYLFDVSRPDTEKRFYQIDCETGAVTRRLAAHGSGSDVNNDNNAESFGNEPGSNKTSLGVYRVAEMRYCDNHKGNECMLDGLEATNANARARAIVMHPASYVNEAQGTCGRSSGCPALDPKYSAEICENARDGSPLFIFKG